MKKFLVVLVILTVAITGVFAETGDAGNGSITVYGFIKVGDHDFNVISEHDSEDAIDLVGNQNVQPGAPGVRVGYWTFAADTQDSGTSFTIAYDTTPLTSTALPGVSYAFEVLEIEDPQNTEGYSNKTITFIDSPDRDIMQGLAVRLLAAIPGGAKPADFTGYITVTLTAEN